ncbi:MAG: hypothetical protein ABSB67_14285 [Bryobacteraceae bacterium]
MAFSQIIDKETPMRLVLLGAVCALCAFAGNPDREVLTQAFAFADAPVPVFRHGYLVTFPPVRGPFNSFSVFARDGRLAFEKTIELPGAGSSVSIADVDLDADGNVAVAAHAPGSGGCMLHVVLVLDRTGRQTKLINTGCFVVGHLAIGPDHSIWTLGWQRAPGSTEEDWQDYMIVRRFTMDGKQVSAFLPRSLFPKGLEPGSPGGDLGIQVTPGRVGVLVYAGTTSKNREWVELDLNGKIVERLRVDNVRSPTQFAFTADNHVYFQGEGGGGSLLTLDNALDALKSVPKQATNLMGADGNDLVYQGGCCGEVNLQWFSQPLDLEPPLAPLIDGSLTTPKL